MLTEPMFMLLHLCLHVSGDLVNKLGTVVKDKFVRKALQCFLILRSFLLFKHLKYLKTGCDIIKGCDLLCLGVMHANVTTLM